MPALTAGGGVYKTTDGGATWTPLEPIGDYGGIVAMGDLIEVDGGEHLAFFHDDGRFIRENGEWKIVHRHADPIDDRQALMKERGQILRTLGPIAQGRADFDAATVMAALLVVRLLLNLSGHRNVPSCSSAPRTPPTGTSSSCSASPGAWT